MIAKQKNLKRKGMLLVFSLLFTLVLMMLVGSLLILSRQGAYSSGRYSGKVAALYAAEAGLADAVAQLNSDNSWAPSSDYVVRLPNGKASYRIKFASSPGVQPDLSVNNLTSTGAVDGPRGPGSVPPASVYLLVDGEAHGVTRRLEVLLQSTPFVTFQSPLVASGRIQLAGNVKVTGLESLSGINLVDAGIHSNSLGSDPRTVYWDSSPGETAVISGEVTTSATGSNVIDMNSGSGTYTSNGEQTGVGHVAFPALDVEAAVVAAASASPFSPVVGLNVVSGGDRHYSGGTVYGDLVLDGGNLYVDGDLQINGSITGTGSVFVTGNTTFSGAADVNVSEEGHVALYSKGHVLLQGFDGDSFLTALTQSVGQEHLMTNISQGLKGAQALVGDGSNYGVAGSSFGHSNSESELYRRLLGQTTVAIGLPPNFTASDSDSLGQLLTILQSVTPADPGEARTIGFLNKKLTNVRALFESYSGQPLSPTEIDEYVNQGVVVPGLFDWINDRGNLNQAGAVLATDIQAIDFDAIGTSYFKGIVYTNGVFASQNEVKVVGGAYSELD